MSTAKNRKPITIQLTPGKDDDLITLIGGLTGVSRNAALKDVLRAGFNLPRSNGHGEPSDVRQLEQKLAALENMIGADLADYLRGEFSEVKDAISKATLGNPGAPEPPPIEPVKRLTAEEKARRAAKMAKSGW